MLVGLNNLPWGGRVATGRNLLQLVELALRGLPKDIRDGSTVYIQFYSVDTLQCIILYFPERSVFIHLAPHTVLQLGGKRRVRVGVRYPPPKGTLNSKEEPLRSCTCLST